jgi:hypothetical protein
MILLWVALGAASGSLGCSYPTSPPQKPTAQAPEIQQQTAATPLLPTVATTYPTLPAFAAPATRAARIPDAKTTLYYLASDELEGRGIGTRGLDKAADYLAKQFGQIGLKPAAAPGMQGYFQPFEMTTASEVAPGTKLSSGDRIFTVKQDFIPLSFSAEKDFAGDVVFAGYGISSDKYKYDDYAGLDVKGKVVLIMRFEPRNEKGTSAFTGDDWSTEAHLTTKAKVAHEHGAAGILLVTPPDSGNSAAEGLMPFAGGPGGVGGGAAKIPGVQIKQSVADELLKRGGGPDLKTLAGKIDSTASPASFALAGVSVKGNIDIDHKRAPVKNVVGMLSGSGSRANEYIVIGAHYDHLGYGGMGSLAPTTRAIHNGADDNASGTTALLQIAERLADGPPPPRSIIFVAFTGEEEGIIGSDYFVDHPPVPLSDIVAMLNLDMVGRLKDEVLYVGGTGTAKNFDEIIKQADEHSKLSWKDTGKGGLGPSDHMAFGLKKIPVLFFFTGLHPDYHRPTDDADKVNYKGLDEVIDFVTDVAQRVAAMPRQQYVAAFDSQSMKMGTPSASRVSLGVIPDYSTMGNGGGGGGVKISGTSPGSPAAKAGLKEGDIIIQFGDAKLDSLYDLSDSLGKAKPGDKVHLKIKRGPETVETDATLVERK